jgi:hypothetical protein
MQVALRVVVVVAPRHVLTHVAFVLDSWALEVGRFPGAAVIPRASGTPILGERGLLRT